MACSAGRPAFPSQVVLKHSRARALDVSGRCQQDHRCAMAPGNETGDGIPGLTYSQFLPVPAGELLEAVRVVAVPPTQLGTRRHVLCPVVDVGIRLLYAPRPEAV